MAICDVLNSPGLTGTSPLSKLMAPLRITSDCILMSSGELGSLLFEAKESSTNSKFGFNL